MSRMFLLDLDGTLLQNDVDRFVSAYLRAFSRLVAPYLNPEHFAAQLMKGTGMMVANRRPDQTLQDAFEAAFFPDLGLERSDFIPLAERFYAEVFPSLQPLTRPVPGAEALLYELNRRGDGLAVATNPLFPQTAIQQRLAWAGVPADCYPYKTITSYENYHFAKPSPLYLAEVLAHLGWPEGEMLVVGNDLEQDILPALSLGLAVFWLDESTSPAPAGLAGRGVLADLLPWLDAAAPQSLQPDFSGLPALLTTLRTTPAALDSWQRSMPPAAWNNRPAAGEWAAVEVLCHLRDVEVEVNLPRLRKILSGSNPFVPGQDPDPWAEQRRYLQQDAAQALAQFCQARVETLELLEALDDEGWQRPARHAILGPTSLREMAGIIASHDRLHIRQVHAVLAQPSRLN